MVHVAEQPSQLVVLPSSHCSVPHTTPSPQPVTSVQAFLQPSQLFVLPSSHYPRGLPVPLPKSRWRWQVHSQPPGLGGSHCSPQAVSTIPSPQRSPVSTMHVAEQPSQLVVLPSSHCSVPHTTPS